MLLHRRILIIGCPGSGKSTLSQRLSAQLNLPCYHLDDFYWQANWQRPKEVEWVAQLDTLIQNEEWIIDGNYYRYLPKRLTRATGVIYLDAPLYLCLYRIIVRGLMRLWRSQDTLPLATRKENFCVFPRISFKFLKLILFFNVLYRDNTLKLLKKNNMNHVALKIRKKSTQALIDSLNNIPWLQGKV